MTLAEEKYERFLHSSYGAVIFSLVAVAGMFLASDFVRPMPLFGNHGIVFPSINLWLPSSLYSWADYIAIAGQVVLAAILVAVNHFYKISRSSSITFAALFLWLQGMLPSLSTQIHSGLFVGVVMLVAISLMLGSYNAPRSVRSVYLAFFLMSTASLWQIVLLPLTAAMFVFGLPTMKIFRLKAFLAALLGIATPWWFFFCVGFPVTPDFHWHFSTAIFTTIPHWQLIHLLVAAALSIIIGMSLTGVNMLRIISANSRTRSTNGLLVLLAVVTTLLLFIDSDNFPAYLTLINILAAFQIGHFLHIYKGTRLCYITITVLVAVEFGLYVWELWI